MTLQDSKILKILQLADLEIAESLYHERLGGLYYHCSIYVGQGRVMHYSPNPRNGLLGNSLEYLTGDVAVRTDCILDVIRDSPTYCFKSLRNNPAERYEMILDALPRIGEKSYSLFFNNCRDFCKDVTGTGTVPLDMLTLNPVNITPSGFNGLCEIPILQNIQSSSFNIQETDSKNIVATLSGGNQMCPLTNSKFCTKTKQMKANTSRTEYDTCSLKQYHQYQDSVNSQLDSFNFTATESAATGSIHNICPVTRTNTSIIPERDLSISSNDYHLGKETGNFVFFKDLHLFLPCLLLLVLTFVIGHLVLGTDPKSRGRNCTRRVPELLSFESEDMLI